MKKSVFVVTGIFLLMVLPMVLAVEIDVKTLSGHKVVIFIRPPGEFDVLDFHQGKADDGVVSFESGFSQNPVDLQVNVVTSNGDYVITKKYTDVDATGHISLYLPSESGAKIEATPLAGESEEEVVDEVEEEANEEQEEAAVEEEIVEEEVVEEEIVEDVVEEKDVVSPGITGNAVEDIKGALDSKTTYYVLGAIVGLFALLFLIQIGRKKIGGSGGFKVGGDDKMIADAENKLAVAKKELDMIKTRRKKLSDAKAKFQKDKEELSKLEE